jgi:ubiquinone/menaquinone biosynthesis C-methylase UbiE
MPTLDKNWKFKFMSLIFKIRDIYYPRKKVLDEVGIKPGWRILDFGCGSGSYIQPALEMIGNGGKYYALDISPYAIKAVVREIEKDNLFGVETIQSDLDTGLNDETVDVVLLYDIFHMIDNQDLLLRELSRVLKTEGTLSVSDHHMKESNILSRISGEGLFELSKKGKKTYSFVKK